MCGTITGGMFKCTLGMVPTGMGAALGGSLVGSCTLLVDYLFKRGYVSFEMKFWVYLINWILLLIKIKFLLCMFILKYINYK